MVVHVFVKVMSKAVAAYPVESSIITAGVLGV